MCVTQLVAYLCFWHGRVPEANTYTFADIQQDAERETSVYLGAHLCQAGRLFVVPAAQLIGPALRLLRCALL